MRKYILPLFIGFSLFLSPIIVFATPVSWDKTGSILQPLQTAWSDQIKGAFFTATSTTKSTFPYASTTDASVSTALWLNALTTGGLAVDGNGLVYKAATTTAGTGLTYSGNAFNISAPVSIALGGTNATSFTTSGNGVYWNGTSLLTAPLTSAVTYPYATTTALSAATLCLTGDVCRTTWPSAGAAFPFTPTTNYSQNVNATTTALWLQGTPFSLMASGTAAFASASTTAFTNSGPTWLSTLTTGGLAVDGNGLIYKQATSTPTVTAPITYSGTLGQFLAGSSGTFGCTSAASGVTGCLTSTDWGTFQNKVSSTSLTGASVISYTSGTGVITTAAGNFGGTSGNYNFQGGTTISYASSTPWGTLSINPTAGVASNQFVVGSSTALAFLINNSGKVGIGTSTPTSQLSINSTAGLDPFAIGSTTGSVFGINQYGQPTLCETMFTPTSTAMVLDWSQGCRQVMFQVGTSAFSITIINATTTRYAASTKVVYVCNPGSTAGAITWQGVEWIGTAPTQTTTSNQCDVYNFNVTHATSTSAFKVSGQSGTGFQ